MRKFYTFHLKFLSTKSLVNLYICESNRRYAHSEWYNYVGLEEYLTHWQLYIDHIKSILVRRLEKQNVRENQSH